MKDLVINHSATKSDKAQASAPSSDKTQQSGGFAKEKKTQSTHEILNSVVDGVACIYDANYYCVYSFNQDEWPL